MDPSEIDFFQIASELNHQRANPPAPEATVGNLIGQYRIEKSVGRGGFGEVFEAYDEVLLRKVALKKIDTGNDPKHNEAILEEGRTLARLNHPGIVKVHAVEKDDDTICFVSEFVEGRTLGEIMSREDLSLTQSAEIVSKIAGALAYAHERKVIHLDLKPNNIILSTDYSPVLIDFGIAVTPRSRTSASQGFVGSPPFVSPEQARCESHLIDKRSDIYCLGVILFALITKKLPFVGTPEQVIAKICSPKEAVQSLHRHIENCPGSLERICSKATAKRPDDRYSNAADLAKDLRDFVQDYHRSESPIEPPDSATIVPKGLRAFDSNDADFFVEMLPGIRDSRGIPDSLRFWQSRIENPSMTFRVGVLYGPSGSGKSSFIRAGLLPLLDSSISVIIVSAETGDLEKALLEKLRNTYVGISKDLSLSMTLREIRERDFACETFKLLLVIDQFEQWLYPEANDTNRELLLAIRQSDGIQVQTILCVRDDFWLEISQFMEEVGEPLSQSHNCAPSVLFDRDHARRVLSLFGDAYGKLSRSPDRLTQSEADFIDSALDNLSQDGKFYPVQLSLFAELTKKMDWASQTLRKLGGLQAIGIEFLNSSFSSQSANQNHRSIEREARIILEAFLPDGGEELRLKQLSESDLKNLPHFKLHPSKLEPALKILDLELRIITSVERHSDPELQTDMSKHERHFQLSHDYLVHSIRDWIHSRKQGSRRGRAQIRLDELSKLYQHKNDPRYLPSFFEWIRIGSLTNRKSWSAIQSHLMITKGRRTLAALLLVSILAGGIFFLANVISEEHSRKNSFEEYLNAPPSTAALLLPQQRAQYRLEKADEQLLLREAAPESTRWLNLALFLHSEENSLAPAIIKRALKGEADEISFILQHLKKPHLSDSAIDALWQEIFNPKLSHATTLRYAAVLAELSPDDTKWQELGPNVSQILLGLPPPDLNKWMHFFDSTSNTLTPHLEDAFGSWMPATGKHIPAKASKSDKSTTAAIILCYLNREDPSKLCTLLDRASPHQLIHVLDRLTISRQFPENEIKDRVQLTTGSSPDNPDTRGQVSAKALLALARRGDSPGLWESLALEDSASANARLWIIQLAAKSGVPPQVFIQHLVDEENPLAISSILQILGEYTAEHDIFRTTGLESFVVELFAKHSDSLVHASARWLLQEWGWSEQRLQEIRESSEPIGSAGWFYTSLGHGMVIPQKAKSKTSPARFAISMSEVTIEQYWKFSPKYHPVEVLVSGEDCPVHNISAQEAMKYCNWLSIEEGLTTADLCYEQNNPSSAALHPVPNFLQKKGYRMPTLNEFLYAGSGSTSGRRSSMQNSASMFSNAWFLDNSDGVIHPIAQLKPTGFGLFDALGNLEEYCHGMSPGKIYFAGSNYRTPSWGLSLDKNQETNTGSILVGTTFRIAKTFKENTIVLNP